MPLLLSTALMACSTDGLLPPSDIDGTTRVSSVQPKAPARQLVRAQTTQAYPASATPVATADYLDNSNLAGTSAGTRGGADAVAPQRLPMIDSDEALQVSGGPRSLAIPSDGINMDEGLGVAPVVGLAEEQSEDIAEGSASQPVVAGIGTDNPAMLVSRTLPASGAGQEVRAAPVWTGQSATTEQGQQVALLMRPDNPMAAPQSSAPGTMPAAERSCRDQLRRLGVQFRDIPSISNGSSCGISYPIELSGLSGNIQVRPATKLNCQVTLAFAKWVKNELTPSSRARYWSGVKTIVPLGGYSCRRMNSSGRNPWSEHAKGNAIDVGKFVLNNGKQIDVRKPGFFAFREKGLLKAVRSDSCKYFHTVLGPGSDRYHKDHFHFDLRTRRSGYRHCD